MADPVLTYGATLREAMDLGVGPQRPGLRVGTSLTGPGSLRSNLADVEVQRQQALERVASIGAEAAPRLQPPPETALQAGPGIYYSPSQDRFAAGGTTFGRTDYDVALRAAQNLDVPTTPPEDIQDWQPISQTQFSGYLNTISEGRGILGGLRVGAQNVGEGIVGGTGRLLQMAGAEDAGQALVGAGEFLGLSPAEQARSAAISQRQGFAGQVGTAVVESAPTLATAVAAGLAGAAVGGPVGAIAGVALSILPMEVQSSWEAAEQNGLDPTNPEVQTDIMMSALTKTAVQSVGPAIIARGFSPALRSVVGDVTGRTLGQRLMRGVGVGAVEGSAEAFAQITDRVVFDPELRALLNEADVAALTPLVLERYGREAAVAFSAGFLLAGPLGAIGTPETTAPRRDLSGTQATDVLNGTAVEPQMEMFPGEDLGVPPVSPAAAPIQEEMFPGQDLGVAPDPRQMDLFEQPGYTIPSEQPGYQMPLPFGQPAAVEPAPQVQMELPLEAAPGTQGDLFGVQPPIVQPQPAPRPAPVQPAGFTDGQAEMFTPAEMGLPVATQALLRGQPIPFSTPPAPTVEAPTQAELEAAGQERLPLTVSFAPPPPPITSQIAEQLAPVRRQMDVEQAYEQRAEQQRQQRDAEFEAAQTQRAQEEAQRAADRAPGSDADIAWEQVRPEGAQVTFNELTTRAQDTWVDAVRDGTADAALYNQLRRRTDPKKLRRRAAMARAQETVAPQQAVPSSAPTGAQRLRRTAAPVAETTVQPAPAAEAAVEAAPAAEAPAPRGAQRLRRGTRAVQEPSPAEVDVREQTGDGETVGVGDTQQEAAGARAEETQVEAQEAGQEVAVTVGRGGRREIGAAPAPEAPTTVEEAQPETRQATQAESDAAELDSAISDVETATNTKNFVDRLADVIFWSKNTTGKTQERAKAFLEEMRNDPMVATEVKAAEALERAQRKDPGVTAEDILAADTDTQIVVQTLEDLNSGKLQGMTYQQRGIVSQAWKRIRGENPQYGGEPLANFINESAPEFFNFGPRREDGIRPVVSKNTGRTKLASYDVVTNPLPRGKAEMVAKTFISKLAVKPKVRVYKNLAEFQRKAPELYAEADAARPQGDFATIEAAGYSFGDGNVLIFSDNIVDEAHLKAVLAHETMGHFGMRGLLPQAQFNSLMDAIYDASENVQSAADAAMANRGIGKAEAVEEYLADFAANLETSLLARIWNTLKNALNKIGVKFEDDAARYLVGQARKYVRNGTTSSPFINSEIAAKVHAMESGVDDGTGRFMPANTLNGVGIQAGLVDSTVPAWSQERLVRDFRNLADFWDRMKGSVFSLTNFRAKQNPGLRKFYDIIMAANHQSMMIKNKANENLRGYFDRAIEAAGVRVGSGASSQDNSNTNNLLYFGRLKNLAGFREMRDSEMEPLVTVENGEVRRNEAFIEKLRGMGRLTLKQARDGFDIQEYVEVPMDDAQRQRLRTERDAALKKAGTQAERDAIETDYKAQLAAETYEQLQTRRFEGIPDLTENSTAWKNYLAMRQELEEISIQYVEAAYKAHDKIIDGQLYAVSEAMQQRMTAQDRQFLLRMNEKYVELFGEALGVDGNGDTTNANNFVEAVNKALLGKGTDRHAAVLDYFDAADRAAIEADMQGFKTRFDPSASQRFVVQNAIKDITANEISRNDGTKQAIQNIATGYVPFMRRGRFQIRMRAVDENGNPLKVAEGFERQMAYQQIDGMGEASIISGRMNELLGDQEFEVSVWDSPSQGYKLRKVRLEAVAEEALNAIAAPPQLNLNEFIIGLRRFGINLDPKKMEEVVTTLTTQNSRARKRLQLRNVPGVDMDMGRAASEYIESQASVIAKMLVRPDLDRLMNLSLRESMSMWKADEAMPDGTPKIDYLRQRYEATLADPNATDAAKVEAKRAFDEYAYMQKTTNQAQASGVGRGFRYYNEAANALAFMENQKNLDESDFGSGDTASRIRAATSLMQLGASPATAMLNVISVATNTIPYLATYNPNTAFGGGFGMGPTTAALSKAMRQVGGPGTLDSDKNTATYYRNLASDEQALAKAGLTQDEALFLAREIDEGVAIPALSNAMIASARGRMTSGAAQKFIDGWMVFFNRTEQASRRAVLLAAYRLQYDRGIQAGKPPEVAAREAGDFAVTTAEDTLGEYSVMNRPAMWRGGVQQFLYMYKVFPTMSVQLLSNLPRKGQLIMLGGLVALSGLSGIPFAEDIEDLVDTIAARLGLAQPSLRLRIAQALEEVAPGWSPTLINGFANAFVPGDIGGRTSLGDMFPGTSIFLPGANLGRELLSIAGPAAGAAQGLLTTTSGLGQWAAYTSGISDRPASLESVARNAPVTMVRAWADALAYMESGAIVDKRGYTVTQDLSAMQVMARAFGFYPSAAAEQYDIIRVSQRVANMQRDIAATYYNAFVQARLRGDVRSANSVLREVNDWNRENRGTGLEINNFQRNAMRRLRDAQRSATERTLRYAPRTARQQYENAADLLGY